MNHPLDIFDDRGLDALGRLVEDQQPRPGHQGAGDGELLLLAARQVAAAPPQHGFEHREQVENLVGDLAQGAFDRGKAGLQVFLDREQREDLAALGHVGDAVARPAVGGPGADLVALPFDAPGERRMLAGDGAQQAGLAHAVAPEHAGHLADFGGERHMAQHLGGAVGQVEVFDAQHIRHRPR